MKTILHLLPLLSLNLHSQTSRLQIETMKVEWISELDVPPHPEFGRDYEQITALLLKAGDGMCTVSNLNGTFIYTFDQTQQAHQTHVLPVFTSWWQFDRGSLFYKDHCNIVRTTWKTWEKQQEICHMAEPDWPATSPVACMQNGSLYYAHYNKFFIFNWLAAPSVSIQIDEFGDPKFLRKGGDYVYLQGSYKTLGSRLMQYDTLGNQRWSVDPGFVTNILADEAGHCYVLSGKAQSHAVIYKYDKTGKVVWSKDVPGQYILNAFINGDSLFLCGGMSMDRSKNGTQPGAFSIMSASSGEILYQHQFQMFHEGYWLEQFTHVASDGKSVYLGGKTDGQNKKNFLIKLSREGNTTGLKDEKGTRANFNIFPNPGGTKFTITCENNKTKTLKVTVRNLAGQVVLDKEIPCNADGGYTLDLGQHPAGNYTVETAIGNDVSVQKIVVE